MKKLLYGLAALLLLVVVAAVVLVSVFFDEEQIKARVSAEVAAATGRELAIDGDLDITILPTPGVRASGVRFANLEGATAPDMVTLKEVEVRLALAPLLGGEIQVSSVRLVEPVIELEVRADGRANWIFGPAVPVEEKHRDEETGAAAADGAGGAIRVDRLEIENGTLTYRDAAKGTVERIERLNARLSADSLRGPFSAKGEMIARAVPVAFDVSVGRLGGDHGIPVRLSIELLNAEAGLTFAGTASEASKEATLTGKLRAQGPSLGALVAALSAATGGAERAPALLAQGFRLEAAVAASATEAALNDIELMLGDARARGAVNAALNSPLRVDATLTLSRLDLDAWLERAGPAAPAAKGQAEEQGQTAAAASAFTLPSDIDGSLTVNIDAVVFRGAVMRQVQLAAALADGRLELNKASALLPGSSDISLTGTAVTVEDKPRFDGRVELASDNLRSLLGWLGAEVGRVPSDRLHKLSLTGNVRLTPELVQLHGADMRLDTSRLTLAAAIALRERVSFSLDVGVDHFNLDAYLPPKSEAQDKAGPSPGKPEEAAADDSALALLDRFDANVKARVDSLVVNKQQLSDLELEASLISGVLNVRKATLKHAAGASATLQGSARGFAAEPAFKVNFDVQAADLGRLLDALGGAAPPEGAKLGGAGAKGSLQGNLEDLKLDVKVLAAGAQVALAGAVGDLMTTPRFDLEIDASHPSLAKLAGTLGTELKAARGGTDGPLAVKGRLAGGFDALQLRLSLKAAGANLEVAGKVTPESPAGPTYDLDIKAGHPDLPKFLRTLGIDYRPAAVNLGGFTLSAKAAGDAASAKLSGLEGKLGPVRLAGAMTARWDGERPRLVGNLDTSEIIVDLFLPIAGAGAASGGAGKSKAAPAGGGTARWSVEPIEVDWLKAVDVELAIAGRGIVFQGYEFREPKVIVRLEDGVLRIDPLTGKLFGGDLDLRVKVQARSALALGLSISLRNGDLFKALKQSADLDRISGRFELQGQFQSTGRNQYEIVSALAGKGRISARDGAIRGFDLRALSDQLGNLDGVLDLGNLISVSMSGGQTRMISFDSTFAVAKGIAKTSDGRLVLDGGEGETTGTIDLPRWVLNLRARFRLPEHPEAPSFGLDLAGPLDEPKRTLKTGKLQRYLAQRVGATVWRKTLGAKEAVGDTVTGGSQGVQEAVGGLLGGVLGRLGGGQRSQEQQPEQQPEPQQQPAPGGVEGLIQSLGGLLGGIKK